MDYKLYRDLNYIVLIQDTVRVDYPIVNTYYTYNENSQDYTIRTANTKIRESVINRGDISNYSNELNVNYDENTMLSFIRLYASLTDKIPAPIIPPTVPTLPSGIYVPKNTVVGAFDLLWKDVSADCDSGDGYINRVSGSGDFDVSGYCLIPHNGDLTIKWKTGNVGGSAYPMAGASFYKARSYYANLDFAIYRDSTNHLVYENGESKSTISDASSVIEYSLERIDNVITYKVNSTELRSVQITNNGSINFDTSFAGISQVFDIEIIIP